MKRALTGLLLAGALTGAAALPATAAAELPQELHYELVSPLASRGFDFTRAWLFADGERGVIGSELADVNGVFTVRRTETAWETGYRGITSPNVTPLVASATYAVSDDLSRILVGGVKPGSFYLTPNELALSEPDGRWKTIGGPLQFAGGNGTLDRVVVQLSHGSDRSELFPDFPTPKTDVFLWTDDGTADGALTAIGADVPRLVTCGAQVPDGAGRRFLQGGVSPDARTVLLSSTRDCLDPDTFEPLPQHVYLWRDGQGTVDLSDPPSGPDEPTTVVGHTTDLSSVFLRSSVAFDPADDNDSADVYRYDVASGSYTRLTGAATDTGATLRYAVSSDDGGRVWFATDSGSDATLWTAARGEAPRAVKVAEGGAGTTAFELDGADHLGGLPTQTTADGETVVWSTSTVIDGLGGSASTGDNGQLFRATADGAFDCLTCAADGAPAAAVDDGDVLMTLQLGQRTTSADGRWVYFETASALEADDHNELVDVYAWHDGVRSLISAGDPTVGANLAGVSHQGDAFFKTFAQLLPWIDDGHLKVYAARHGSDLPAPRDPREGCTGDDCQGGPQPRVDPPRDPSETFTGPDDVDDPAPRFPANPSITVGALSRAARARLAAGRRVTLPVRANTGGRVTATVRYKAGRRWLRAGGAARTLKRAGTARLSLRLSRAARRQLARRGALRVRIDVVHGRVAKERRLAFVLKQATPTRRGARA